MTLEVRPVTSGTWPEMVQLFEGEGCPHDCWCMPYRHPKSQDLDKASRKAAMGELVASGTPVGYRLFASFWSSRTVFQFRLVTVDPTSRSRSAVVRPESAPRGP